MTGPEKTLLREVQTACDLADKLHLKKLLKTPEHLGAAIETALKEVEALEKVTKWLRKYANRTNLSGPHNHGFMSCATMALTEIEVQLAGIRRDQ